LYCNNLSKNFPNVSVDSNSIFVKDANIYTSAGVTTGMDLALELVEEDLGAEMALDISRALVIFLRRPGGQSQFSVTLKTSSPKRPNLRDLPVWILEHISEPLPIEVLANQVAMSLRHFARVFASEFGMTPAQYVLEQRVEAARRTLSQTTLGQKEIAIKCGFGNVEHMRRAFLRITGVTPGMYRNHFNHPVK
jgi:transcriptional regulator GlxA family with amidase domain